jgi:surface polysaccharide O-acyltransferase-like enzyme
MLVTETGSGWVAKVIEEIGTQYRIPFLVVYGIAQPVLPATIAEPTLPFWKVINIARASGWYLLAPLLIYAVFSLFKQKQPAERRVWIWMVLFSLFWVVISSARAGGDQWDNPRYRANMLPWLVLVAGWAVQQAIIHRDAWLPRWLLVEAVFLGFFTNWYFSRYFLTWKRMFFWEMITWIVGLSVVILVGGFVYDRWIKPKFIKKQQV